MHKIAAFALAAIGWSVLPAQIPKETITIEEIVKDISQFRRYILRDSAAVDYCALAEAFDSQGKFRQPPETPLPRYSTLEACRAAAATYKTGPVVQRVEVRGDTVLVKGYTRRGTRSSIAFMEVFRYIPVAGARSPQSRFARMYMIVGIVQDD